MVLLLTIGAQVWIGLLLGGFLGLQDPMFGDEARDVPLNFDLGDVIAIAAVIISCVSLVLSFWARYKDRKAEEIKELLGEKEAVAFAALRLLRDGLPKGRRERKLVLAAIMQACVFEGSDRTRAILYRVLLINLKKRRIEIEDALMSIRETFDLMGQFQFSPEELDLSRGMRRIGAVSKVIGWKPKVDPD